MKEDAARGLLTRALPRRAQLHAFDDASSPDNSESPVELIRVQALAKLVRDTRESRSLTQSQLAAKAGTGRQFISDFEGEKETVEFGKVLRVCQALGLTLTASETPDGP